LPEKELDKVVGGVSLNFSKIELSYTPQNADGTAGK
jgi:type VI protein secretion system component Hcp